MTCPRCGADTDHGHFCSECGAALEEPTQVLPTATGAAPTPPPAPLPPAYLPPAVGPGAAGSIGGGTAPRRTSVGLVVGLVAAGLVVLVAVVAMAVWLMSRSSGGDVVDVQPAPIPWQPATPSATAVQTTPAATPTAAPPVTTAPRDYGGVDCGGGVAAVGPTSCAFALSVRDAYYFYGGSTYLPDVYSPATGLYYEMFCSATSTLVRCTGGNDAEVVFRP